MFWTGITWKGRTELAEVRGTFKADNYVENILLNIMLRHDKATLAAHNSDNLDLNPIEHLSDQLKIRIRIRNPLIMTPNQLRFVAQ